MKPELKITVKKILFQRTAAMLAVLLLIHSSFSWGETIPTGLPIEGLSAAAPKTGFYLPDKWGRVRETFQGDGSARLVLVEDAHVQEEAQRKIGGILDFLAHKYGLNWIYVEGASGELEHRLLSTHPNRSARRLLADRLLYENALSGAEYAALRAHPEFRLYGVEDPGLYEQNRTAFFNTAKIRERCRPFLTALEKRAAQLMPLVFSPDLRQWSQIKARFETDGAFAEYIEFINTLAEKYNADTPRPLIQDFIELLRFDREGLPFGEQAAKPESSSRHLKLKKKLSRSGPALFEEISQLEKALRQKVVRTAAQDELYTLLTDLEMIRKLSSLSLTADEAVYLFNREHETKAGSLKQRFGVLSRQYRFDDDLAGLNPGGFDKDLGEIRKFYDLALSRNDALIERTLGSMRENGVTRAVLITGGFHMPGMTRLLREKKISYSIITPHFSGKLSETEQTRAYADAMDLRPTTLENLASHAGFSMDGRVADPFYQLQTPRRLPYTVLFTEQIPSPEGKQILGQADRRAVDFMQSSAAALSALDALGESRFTKAGLQELLRGHEPKWADALYGWLGRAKVEPQGFFTSWISPPPAGSEGPVYVAWTGSELNPFIPGRRETRFIVPLSSGDFFEMSAVSSLWEAQKLTRRLSDVKRSEVRVAARPVIEQASTPVSPDKVVLTPRPETPTTVKVVPEAVLPAKSSFSLRPAVKAIFPYLPLAADGLGLIFAAAVYGISWQGLVSVFIAAVILRASLNLGIYLHEQGHLTAALSAGYWSSASVNANWRGGLSLKDWLLRLIPLSVPRTVPQIKVPDMTPGTAGEKWVQAAAVPLSIFYLLLVSLALGPWAGWVQGGSFLIGAAFSVAMGALSDYMREEKSKIFCCGVSDELPTVAGPRVKAVRDINSPGASWKPWLAAGVVTGSGVLLALPFLLQAPDLLLVRASTGLGIWLAAVGVRLWITSVIWPRLKNTWETIRRLDFRGQQAAGIELRGTVRPWLRLFFIRTGGDFPVVIKKLNPKRADLATVLAVDIFLKTLFWSLFLKMHQGTEGIHVRFSTSDPSASATQPRSWFKLSFWNMLFGRRPIVTVRHGVMRLAYHWPGTIVRHNGDLFGYSFKQFKTVLDQGGSLHTFLSNILHYTNREGGDTVEVAGLLDLFTTSGDFLASTRLAFLQTVMTAPVKEQMLSKKSEKQIARIFEKIYLKNQAFYKQELASWIKREGIDPAELDLSDAPAALEEKLAEHFAAALRESSSRINGLIPQEKLKAFAKASAKAFFRGDIMSAGRALAFDRSKTENAHDVGDAHGTFGLSGGSARLWRDQFYYSQDQPLSFVFGYVTDALTGKKLLDGKVASTSAVLNLTPRFQSRFDFQDGEILRVRRNSNGTISSISVFSTTRRSFLSEEEIRLRTFDIEKDPFIERPADVIPQNVVQNSRKRMTEAVDAAWNSLRPGAQAALPGSGDSGSYAPDPFNPEVAESFSRAILELHRTAAADFVKAGGRISIQAGEVSAAARKLQSEAGDTRQPALAQIIEWSSEIQKEIQKLVERLQPSAGKTGFLFKDLKELTGTIEKKADQIRGLVESYDLTELESDSQHLFSSAEKILYRRGTDILLTGIQDSLDNAADMAILLRQFFPLLNIELRESNQLSLTLAQIATGDQAAKVNLGLHSRTIVIPFSQSGAFQTAVNTHFLRTQVKEIFALLGGRDNDVARKIGQGRVLSNGAGSFESDQTHMVTNPAMQALAFALVFKTANDMAASGSVGNMFTKADVQFMEKDFKMRVRDAGYITGYDRTRSLVLSPADTPNASVELNSLGRQMAWDIRETGVVTFIMFVIYGVGAQFGLPIFPTSWFQGAFFNVLHPALAGVMGVSVGFWAASILAVAANIAFLYLFGRLVITRLWRMMLTVYASLATRAGFEPYITGRPMADRASSPAYFIHAGYRHIAERLKALSQIILSLKYPHNSPRAIRAESHAEGVHRDRDAARGDRAVNYVPEAPEPRQLATMHGKQFTGNLTKLADFLMGRVSLIEIRHDGSANPKALFSIDLRRSDWLLYAPEKFSSPAAFRSAIEVRDAFNTFDYLLAHNTAWAETARHLWTLGPVSRLMGFLESIFLMKGVLDFIKLKFPWLLLFSPDHRDHSGANQATTQLSPVEIIQNFIANHEAEARAVPGSVSAYRTSFLDLKDSRADRVLGAPILPELYDDGTHPQLHLTAELASREEESQPENAVEPLTIEEPVSDESESVQPTGAVLALRPVTDEEEPGTALTPSSANVLVVPSQANERPSLLWMFEERIRTILKQAMAKEAKLFELDKLETVRLALMTNPSPEGGLQANIKLLMDVEQKIVAAKQTVRAMRSEVRDVSGWKEALQAKTNMAQTVRVRAEIEKMRGLVRQLDALSIQWEEELSSWDEPVIQALGIREPANPRLGGGFIVDRMDEALIQRALDEAPQGVPVLFFLKPEDQKNEKTAELRARFQAELADGRFIIPILNDGEVWTLEKFVLREAAKRGLALQDVYGIAASEAVYRELGRPAVNRVLAGAVKLAEHRLIVAGSAAMIGQPLYTELGWNDLLAAALQAAKATSTAA